MSEWRVIFHFAPITFGVCSAHLAKYKMSKRLVYIHHINDSTIILNHSVFHSNFRGVGNGLIAQCLEPCSEKHEAACMYT